MNNKMMLSVKFSKRILAHEIIYRDFEVQGAPTDSVSSLSFSPKSNLFVASSWDKKVYMYPNNSFFSSQAEEG